MKVLVLGGAGYIGSHTTVELLNQGEEVVIVDNLSNSKLCVLDRIERITGKRPVFYQVDLLDKEALRVIAMMPKWKPGKQRGKAVRVKYTVPVMFRLQ